MQNYEYRIFRTWRFEYRHDRNCIVSAVERRRLPGTETDAVFSARLFDTERRIFV